jgi:hypothetical protein
VRLTTRADEDGFHLDVRLDWGTEYENVVLGNKVISEFAGTIEHTGTQPPPDVDPAGFVARVGESLLNFAGAIKTS